MNPELIGCKNCGGPLRVIVGQFVIHCPYCKSKYFLDQEIPPAVVLKPEIDLSGAKKMILKGLQHKEIAKSFLHNSYFEKAVLYYVPFFEIRGIKAGWTSASISENIEYSYQSFDFLEKANDLSDLSIGFFDYSTVEESILEARQIPYNLVEMRKNGVVLPAKKIDSRSIKVNQTDATLVERHYRLIYFPIWEINYTYRGIIFKSYLSAVNGQVLTIQAIKNHRKKLFLALCGLASLGILLSRSFVFGLLMARSYFWALSLFFLVVLFPIMLFGAFLLIPYLWQLFAFRERVFISGDLVESVPINYSDNKFIKFIKILGNKFYALFSTSQEDDL